MPDGSKKLMQPDMINKLENVFEKSVANIRAISTRMKAETTVIRPSDDDEKLNPTQQHEFRSGVGMLLYLVKHSRPDLSNAVRELSEVMDGATPEHMSMLCQLIKFVLSTKDRGVRIKPYPENGIVAYVDSDYAGDMDNRKSITGYLIFLHDVPVAWKSKQQGGVTLSSSEAEYFAISEVAMELKLLKMILEFLTIDPGIPMKVYVDNIGTIHLANNASSGTRTKHIDTRLQFERELTQGAGKILEIEYVVRTIDVYAPVCSVYLVTTMDTALAIIKLT
jgi:hypothetical protein